MKLFLTLIFSATLFYASFSQIPPIQWQKTFGGSSDERIKSSQQTSDGGYILAGYSNSKDGDLTTNKGDNDYWVVKINSLGVIEWQKTYGGSGADLAYSVIQTSDGGYMVGGFSNSNNGDVTGSHGNNDYWLLKLNSTGTIVWQKTYGGSDDDVFSTIKQTKDGGYIVVGYSKSRDGDVTGNHGNYDSWVLKLSNQGNIEWQKSYGGYDTETAFWIEQTSDGGYIFTGYSNSNSGDVTGNHGDFDFWVVKVNYAGTIEWQKSLGGSGSDASYNIQQTKEGGYIVAGTSNSINNGDVSGSHGSDDFWVVKINYAGTIEWQKSYGGNNSDISQSIKQTQDGGYIVAGLSKSNNGDLTNNYGGYDSWIIKINYAGTIEWQKSFGDSGEDVTFVVQQTKDGQYFASGYTYARDTKTNLIKTNSDFWVFKLGFNTPTNDLFSNNLIKLFPNPTTDLLTVEINEPTATEIIITDVQGKIVNRENLIIGQLKKEFSVSNLHDGIWFVSILKNEQTISSLKFVVQR